MNRPISPLLILYAVLLIPLGLLAYRYLHTEPEPATVPIHQAALRPSSTFLHAGEAIAFYRDQVRRAPDAVQPRVALAQAYLQQALATADEARYLPLAQTLLADVLDRAPQQYHARVLQASLWNTLHRFEDARNLAHSLIAEAPHHAYPWGILVDALVELGAYDEAVAACDSMLARRPGLPAYTRAAYLRELHGDGPGALALLELAAAAGVPGHPDRSWVLYQLGELYLAEGDAGLAQTLFIGLLEEAPDYAFGYGGLGHVHLAEGRYADAVTMLRQAYALAPHDAFLEHLAEAYEALGDTAQRTAVLADLRRGFDEAAALGENVQMELADFLADQGTDLAEALRLARLEYERRPDHLHAAETYAWALHHNGRSAEAMSPIRHALRLGTHDAMLHYRAGLIHQAAGDTAQAHGHLQRALALHLHVESPAAAADARTLLAGGLAS